MKVELERSIVILFCIGATCYLLWALSNRIIVKSSVPTSPHQKPEPIHETTTSDLRALLSSTEAAPQPNETTQCGRIFHKKSRLSDSMISDSIGKGHQLVMESRKALYCDIGRIGSSRWKRLALKSEGLDYLDLPRDKLDKMLVFPLPVSFLYNNLSV